MFKSEKGNSYVNLVIIILVALIFAAMVIRVLVGENGIINQKKEEEIRNKTENNIIFEITNETKY